MKKNWIDAVNEAYSQFEHPTELENRNMGLWGVNEYLSPQQNDELAKRGISPTQNKYVGAFTNAISKTQYGQDKRKKNYGKFYKNGFPGE